MKATILVLFLALKYTYGYVRCPYCDPNHMAYPNLEEAMRGYDVPMGNPNPGRGMTDPGIRNQIFNPMIKNEDNHYQLDMTFVTANHQIKCDATWSSKVYDNFKDYIQGKTQASTTGFGIEFGPSMKAEVGQDEVVSGKSRLGASMSIPPIFSRSWSDSNDVEEVQEFFAKEHGSIVTTEAICLTNKVDVGIYSKKVFVQPFVDAIRALHYATKGDDDLRLVEFKRFINEFGTHYASTSEMGTKLSIERRYSARERESSGKNELKNCNTLAGAKIFGLQSEESNFDCNKRDLLNNSLESNSVERMIVTTHGSFIANSLAEWSTQVISLVQSERFSPRVIRRELTSILHLFEPKNFKNLTVEGEVVNVTLIRNWMEPMMGNYCVIFELNCDQSGCGIDDNCTLEEWCIEEKEEEGYKCIKRKTRMMLPNGREYEGEIDIDLLPNGYGKEFYPSGKLLYAGHFSHGRRHGYGKFYYESGIVGYEGGFNDDFMEGNGALYYQDSGALLFNGTLHQGTFHKGSFYFENSTLSERISK